MATFSYRHVFSFQFVPKQRFSLHYATIELVHKKMSLMEYRVKLGTWRDTEGQ